jgi:RNA polymerase sigma-70 factor (ECF subfamily)
MAVDPISWRGARDVMTDEGEGRRTRRELRLVSRQLRATTGAPPAGGVPEQADDALARAFLGGDDEAFGELVRRHQHSVLTVVRRYAASPDDARDLVQRAFLRALEAARRSMRFRPGRPVPVRAWLLRVAVNLGKNHARDARRWRRAPVQAVDEELDVPAVGSEALEREERSRAVRAAVLELPRRQREVLTLRIDAELSFRDIGQVLGITENNAKVHFHHAAKRLRQLVAGGPKP